MLRAKHTALAPVHRALALAVGGDGSARTGALRHRLGRTGISCPTIQRGLRELEAHHSLPVIRKFMRESICRRSRRITRQAIFMGQPSQNRCREHPSVFGEAMTGGRELVAFGDRLGNPGSGIEPAFASTALALPTARGPAEDQRGDSDPDRSPEHRASRSRRPGAAGRAGGSLCGGQRRSDVGCHATLPQPWIRRENWQFETHRC
jgi:hypothetical protein